MKKSKYRILCIPYKSGTIYRVERKYPGWFRRWQPVDSFAHVDRARREVAICMEAEQCWELNGKPYVLNGHHVGF